MTELSEIVAQLSSGLSGAQHANEQLTRQLEALRGMLAAATRQQLAVEQLVFALRRELSASRTDAERDRQFLIDQHDQFLAAVLEEHELESSERRAGDTGRLSVEVAELVQQLAQAEAEAARVSAEQERARVLAELNEAQRQRDEVQALAVRPQACLSRCLLVPSHVVAEEKDEDVRRRPGPDDVPPL